MITVYLGGFECIQQFPFLSLSLSLCLTRYHVDVDYNDANFNQLREGGQSRDSRGHLALRLPDNGLLGVDGVRGGVHLFPLQ